MTITLPGDGGVATEPESIPESEPASGCECECEAAGLLGIACVSAMFTGGLGRKTNLMVSLTRFLRGVEAVATVMAMDSCVSETSGRDLFVSLMLFGLDGHGVSCTDLVFRALALRCWRCGCCCGWGAVETETEAVVELDSDSFAALLCRREDSESALASTWPETQTSTAERNSPASDPPARPHGSRSRCLRLRCFWHPYALLSSPLWSGWDAGLGCAGTVDAAIRESSRRRCR